METIKDKLEIFKKKIKKNFEITSLITGKNFETVKKLILKKCIQTKLK